MKRSFCHTVLRGTTGIKSTKVIQVLYLQVIVVTAIYYSEMFTFKSNSTNLWVVPNCWVNRVVKPITNPAWLTLSLVHSNLKSTHLILSENSFLNFKDHRSSHLRSSIVYQYSCPSCETGILEVQCVLSWLERLSTRVSGAGMVVDFPILLTQRRRSTENNNAVTSSVCNYLNHYTNSLSPQLKQLKSLLSLAL